MQTKFFPVSKAILPSEEEVADAKTFLRDYYRKVKNVSGNVGAVVNKTIRDCKKGWPNAPKTFKGRVFFKVNLNEDGSPRSSGGYTGENAALKAQNAVLKRAGRAMVGGTKDDSDWLDLNLCLTPKEKAYFESRMKSYSTEFDLNVSSDVPIVEQIIVEEIIQKRAQVEALKAAKGETVNPTVSKILTETYTRLNRAQELLGIAGRQRMDKKNYIEGSILDLHKVYDKTVREFPELEIKWEAEELVLLLRKFNRLELNRGDFNSLTGFSPEIGLKKYKDYIKRKILDKEKDSLELDNFGRNIEELEKFDFQHILQHLHDLNEEEALDEVTDE